MGPNILISASISVIFSTNSIETPIDFPIEKSISTISILVLESTKLYIHKGIRDV